MRHNSARRSGGVIRKGDRGLGRFMSSVAVIGGVAIDQKPPDEPEWDMIPDGQMLLTFNSDEFRRNCQY